MDTKFEVSLEIDGDKVIDKEIKVSDTNKEIIKASLLAGIKKMQEQCEQEVIAAIDGA